MITTTKIFGAIAILLLLSLVDTSSAQETLPPQAYPKEDLGDPENFLFEVNAYRLKYAKENNIPFMNKLTWSQSLAYDAESVYTDRSRKLIGVRYTYIKDYRDVEDHIEEGIMRFKMMSATFQGGYDQVKDSSADEMELLIPSQWKIGCTEREEGSKKLLCLLGPSDIFFTPLVNRDYKKGKPGTRCEPGFENDNGLCVPVKTTTRPPRTPAPLPPPNFDLDSVAASKFSGCFLVMTTIFALFIWN
ncbi:unnamed protein product [Caenorhabditis brenneri]